MTASPDLSPEQFMAATPRGLESNTEWGRRYSRELRGVITRQATLAPRSQQVHLGPSEIGETCDKQVVGKLVGAARTNHVSDPWPSIVGTAVHAWLATACEDDNTRDAVLRWVTEMKVVPHPDYPGHTDLYDAAEQAVVDWKVLGASSLSKIKSPKGPSRRYQVQLLLYGYGVRRLGLPVKRVVLAALPRTASTLDSMFCWDHLLTPEDDELVADVLDQMAARQAAAAMIQSGQLTLNDIKPTPDGDSCFYCFLYRPQSAYDDGPGCPGTIIRGALPRLTTPCRTGPCLTVPGRTQSRPHHALHHRTPPSPAIPDQARPHPRLAGPRRTPSYHAAPNHTTPRRILTTPCRTGPYLAVPGRTQPHPYHAEPSQTTPYNTMPNRAKSSPYRARPYLASPNRTLPQLAISSPCPTPPNHDLRHHTSPDLARSSAERCYLKSELRKFLVKHRVLLTRRQQLQLDSVHELTNKEQIGGAGRTAHDLPFLLPGYLLPRQVADRCLKRYLPAELAAAVLRGFSYGGEPRLEGAQGTG